MRQVKYIGVLGLGEKTTQFYLKKFNQLYHNKYKEYSTCPIKMLQVDFNEINPYLPFDFDVLKPVVLNYLIELNNLGVEVIVVPNITLHLTINQLDLPFGIKNKLIHPFDVKEKASQVSHSQKLMVLGTKYTMEQSFLAELYSSPHLNYDVPSIERVEEIDFIRSEVYEHGVTSEMQMKFDDLLTRYSGQVLIACTELSLLNESNRGIDLIQNQIGNAFRKVYS